MAPVGTGAVFGFGVKNPKFERYFARIDSQEHVHRGFIKSLVKGFILFFLHDNMFVRRQRSISFLPISGRKGCRFKIMDYCQPSAGKPDIFAAGRKKA